MKRQLAITLLLLAPALTARAQIQADTAPAPSSRFPASWYPEDRNTSTEAPVKGVPYSATMFTTYTGPDEKSEPHDITDGGGAYYRDAQGRTRTEEPQTGNYRSPDGLLHPRPVSYRIEVNDPVSHCNFHWTEPWPNTGVPIAQVQCMPRVIHYTPQDRFAWIVAQTPSDDNRGHTVPLGHRAIEGLDTLGIQRTQTPSGLVTEFWYSPQLHELLRFGPVPHSASLPTYELKNIHLGEPDPKLFYPPENYRILKPGETAP